MIGFGKNMKRAFWTAMGLACAWATVMFVSDLSNRTMQDWLRDLFQEWDLSTWLLMVGTLLICVTSCLRIGLGDSGFLDKLLAPVIVTFLGVVYAFVLSFVFVTVEAIITGAIWKVIGGIVAFLVIGAGSIRPAWKVIGVIVEKE